MTVSPFDYVLPDSLIAHHPTANRQESRLLAVNPHTHEMTHHRFSDLIELLPEGAVLVVNNSKVLKARLKATRVSGAEIEVFLLKPKGNNLWEALLRPAKKVKEQERLIWGDNETIRIVSKGSQGQLPLVALEGPEEEYALIDRLGQVPLPPYIQQATTQEANQWEARYQTVFASQTGSVAAPTAGLHFSMEMLEALKHKGIQIETVTLHVGYGTFKPLSEEGVDHHQMHEETYSILPEVATRLNYAKLQKRPIIAVGTTSARTLESAVENGKVVGKDSGTRLFIKPGYQFQIVDSLITNFHLPQSTLLVLVHALLGSKLAQAAYQEAIFQKYRFYSFGDAMWIMP